MKCPNIFREIFHAVCEIWQRAAEFLFDSNKIICVLVSRTLPFLGKRCANKKGVPLNGEPQPKKNKQNKSTKMNLSFSHDCQRPYQMSYIIW